MFEYLAQAQSAVRRINDRLQKLTEHFGSSSKIVQNAISELDVALGDNLRYKDGVAQLHTPSEIYKDEDMNRALESADKSLKTWGEYRKEYEKGYTEYKEQGDFLGDEVASIEDYINTMSDLSSALEWLYPSDTDGKKQAVEIMRIKGRKKTYAELIKVINLVNE